MRKRRTQAEMKALREGIYKILGALHPMTVRQVFYRAVVDALVPKTLAGYRTVKSILTTGRRDHRDIPYEWIVDGTRRVREPLTYSSPAQALRLLTQTYRRALWDRSRERVVIWVEKDAVAGIIEPITDQWDVPLMPGRGYSSLSFLHEAAQRIARHADSGAHTYVYNFGDFDPSGEDISHVVKRGIGDALLAIWERPPSDDSIAAFDEVATFERVALTRPQVEEWNLPGHPTKQSDPREWRFEGDSVELDALDPDQLRDLVRASIERHVDRRQVDAVEAEATVERRTLREIAERFGEQEAEA